MRDEFGHGPSAECGFQQIHADRGRRFHPGADLLHGRMVGPPVGRRGLGDDRPSGRRRQRMDHLQIRRQLRRTPYRGHPLQPRRRRTGNPHDAGGQSPHPVAQGEPHRDFQQPVGPQRRHGEQPQGGLQADQGYDRLFGDPRRGRRRNARARPGVDRKPRNRHRRRHVQHAGEHLAAQATG